MSAQPLTDMTDPAEHAESIKARNDDYGVGVLRDTLIEGHIDADQAAHQAREVAVTLDAIADSQGLFPSDIEAEIRRVQRVAEALAKWFAELSNTLAALVDEAAVEE